MSAIFKSMVRAAALSLSLAFGMTAGHAVLKPEAAQAGVIGGLKSAAKKVGSTVKTAAVTVGSAGKTIGVGIGRNARQGAESLARSPLGYAVKSSIRPVVNAVRR